MRPPQNAGENRGRRGDGRGDGSGFNEAPAECGGKPRDGARPFSKLYTLQ